MLVKHNKTLFWLSAAEHIFRCAQITTARPGCTEVHYYSMQFLNTLAQQAALRQRESKTHTIMAMHTYHHIITCILMAR